MNNVRLHIRKMSLLMEQEFLQHEDRGDPFRSIDDRFLGTRIVEEILEMDAAMRDYKLPSEVWEEAADVCNFVLMRAVNYERGFKERFENG